MSLYQHLYSPAGTWIDELTALLDELPASLLDSWEVYERTFIGRPGRGNAIASAETYRQIPRYDYPSDTLELAYLPESIRPTTWIEHSNKIKIRSWTEYHFRGDYDLDIDAEPSKREHERKYLISGTFVEPIVTRSLGRAVNHIGSSIEQVAGATEFNAELERLTWAKDHYKFRQEEPPESPTAYTEQRGVLLGVDRVGPKGTQRLAERFGTYYNVTTGHPRDVFTCLASQTRTEDVLDGIELVINRYNQFRARDDWDRLDVEPDTWADFPREPVKLFV